MSTPRPRDFKSKQADKYCLQHQEEDSEGDVKTALYKVSQLHVITIGCLKVEGHVGWNNSCLILDLFEIPAQRVLAKRIKFRNILRPGVHTCTVHVTCMILSIHY